MNEIKVELSRVEYSDSGVFGVLLVKGKAFCVTLENSSNYIPDGVYVCKPKTSPKFGRTFEVLSVKDRTDILFHGGNYNEDSTGCILLGESYGKIAGKRAILSSRKAVDKFLKELEGEQLLRLIVRSV